MIPEGMDGCGNGPEDDNCPVTAEVVALDGVGNADGSCMLAKFGVAGDCPTFSLGTEGAAPTRNVDSRFSSIGPATHTEDNVNYKSCTLEFGGNYSCKQI
jgi:hypothetical protein